MMGDKIESMAFVSLVVQALASPAMADVGEQLRKIVASDPSVGAEFGTSVSLSNGKALIGAIRGTAGGGVPYPSGAAYVTDLATGEEITKLWPSDATTRFDFFGTSVALDGDLALIGASNNSADLPASGAAYLFDISSGQELKRLTPEDHMHSDMFGSSVALQNGVAIVGSPGGNGAGVATGAAYLFDTNTYDQLARFTASDAAYSARFGHAVAISSSRALIGATRADGRSNSRAMTGAAYLFDLATNDEIAMLTAPDAMQGDYFGGAVAINEHVAIVGARLDDDAGGNTGAAYVFDASTGDFITKLLASDASGNDHFGDSIALSERWALIGAPTAGPSDDILGPGAAYLFNTSTWKEVAKLVASDAADGEAFGTAVALNSEVAIVGARNDGELRLTHAGSSYLFYLVPEPSSGLHLIAGALLLCAYRRMRSELP